MTLPNINIRLADSGDIPCIARIIREVSEGVVDFLFEGVVPGVSSEAIVELAFTQNMSPYALEHVLLIEVEAKVTALAFIYDAQKQEIPLIMTSFISHSRLQAVKALLTAKVDEALWVNTLWVSPQYRGMGLSGLLMKAIETKAHELGFSCIALHCWADNTRALSFYQKMGFNCEGQILVEGDLRQSHPQSGLLLVKTLSKSS